MPSPSEPPPDDFAQSGEHVETEQPEGLPEGAGLDPEEFPTELIEARVAIEGTLSGQGEQRSGVRSADDLTELTNIQGVGIGRATPAEYGPRRSIVEPGQHTLNVYLAQPRMADDVESVLVEQMGVRVAASPRVPVIPVVTGAIEVHAYTFQRRPAPGGISTIGHPNALATGTLGCLATGRSFPRNQRKLVLSCNHILANSNSGQLGDCVVQPAVGDGGVCPQDLIAVLERFTKVQFGGPINSVDCATAWADEAKVSPHILITGVLGPVEVPISSTTAAASVGSLVFKSGRTTEVRSGTVREVGASHWVGYPGGQAAYFSGSLAIEGNLGSFSEPGDSGSIVWTFDLARNPVGMIFAGTSNASRSFANPIDIVTQSLDIFITDTI
ncbi:hypothetical protein [Streptomyces sp. NPDC090994]|uniref:hypothetical protein n=1 Tax=Streptomyces sp. NPDC090994 TaxID=3365969 RepID=UPI00381AADBD